MLARVIDLVNVYENLTRSMLTRLNGLEKTLKVEINGPQKSWKTTFTVLCDPVFDALLCKCFQKVACCYKWTMFCFHCRLHCSPRNR